MDCRIIIHHLIYKIFSTAFFWFTMMSPPTTDFSGNHEDFEEGAMAASNGLEACVSPIILPIFKFLNVILDQLMD